jgi:hypothetical protein
VGVELTAGRWYHVVGALQQIFGNEYIGCMCEQIVTGVKRGLSH